MSYVREVLQPGEEIRFRTNIHWFVYLPAIVMFIVGLAFALWHTAAGSQHLMLLILSGLSALTGVLLFIPAWLKRFGTEIAVTDRRVIYKTGLMQRETTEINMAKIESVDVSQSILGRVFDFGTLTIRGTGEAFLLVREPQGFAAISTSGTERNRSAGTMPSERQLSTVPSRAVIPLSAISGRSLVHSAPSWSFVRKAFVVTAEIAETARGRVKGVSAIAASSFESLHQGPGE